MNVTRIRREARERDREFERHECHFFERHWWIGLALWLAYGLYLVVARP